jgi:hypothetical protein
MGCGTKADPRRRLTPAKEGLLSRNHYGYGWSIGKTPHGTRVIEHNGSNTIFFADFRRYVDDGVVLIFASNAFTLRDLSVGDRLSELIFSTEGHRKGSRR